MRKLVMVPLMVLLMIGVAFGSQTISVSSATNGITVLDRDQNGVTLKVSVGSLEAAPVVTKGGTFTFLSADGFSRSQLVGEPNLPLATELVSIPLGAEMNAEVISSDVTEISLRDYGITDLLMPVQPSLSKSQNPEDVPFEYRGDVYMKTGYYQLASANAEVIGIMRGLRVGFVAISPIQYNPTENKIKVCKEMTVRVSFAHPNLSATQDLYRNTYTTAFEPAYQQILNSDVSKADSKADLTKYPIKYVIVSARMFEAQLQPFIAWKIKKGFNVIVAYTDVIGSTTAAIKTYLQGLYNAGTPSDPAPSFVLFVGDINQIPTWAGSAGSHPTDLRYCEYTGDNLPEVYYGRFSANTTAELQPQIDKTLEYEQYTMPNPSYLGNCTLTAGVDASYAPTYGNGQINYGTVNYFNTAHGIAANVWLYPASSQSGAAAAIIATVNSGVGYINYTAHGSETGWYDPPFSVSDVATLTNAHKYNLAVGNCCVTSSYDYSSTCFAEAWLQKANGGGIGYIGCSNNSYWDEDYWWGVGGGKAIVAAGPPYDATKIGAYDGVFHDHSEPTSQYYVANDAINVCGCLAVQQSGSSRAAYYWESYCLMGDPSVITYMRVPSANNISYQPTILMTSTTFNVQADAGSLVAISVNGVLHGSAYVDQSGSVDVPLTAFAQPGVADIVITAQNKVPHIATVQVIAPSGPYVVHDGYTINDASGNNNGIVDFGETIVLGERLKNVGPDAAHNVVATLSTVDSYITVTDATENYGDIAPNMGTVNIANAFTFTADPGTPDGHQVTFDLAVTGTAKDTWNSSFKITVHAPTVAYLSVAVNDVSGNNNGILDPGETAPVIITLQNSGTGKAFNITAIMSELDDQVDITDNSGTFGDIEPGGGTASNSTDVFEVHASATCPMGHGLLAKLTIYGNGGYVATSNFNLTVGDRAVFFFEDFAAEQGWTGLGSSAQWQIGPAIGGTSSSGSPDPSDDHTPGSTNFVLGNNLGNPGSYANSISGTQWIYSPIIDCSNASGVQMSYFHVLGVESATYDHAYFEVFDGTQWVNLYSNPSASGSEASWTESDYDLADYADNNPDFQLRWGLGSTDGSATYCGWNIDDIQLKGYISSSGGSAIYQFSPEMFSDSMVEGQTEIYNLTVRNIGQANLRMRFSPAVTWLSCNSQLNTILPGDSAIIPVNMNSAGMTPGMNTGALNFTSNVPGHTTGSITAECYIFIPQIVTNPASVQAYVDSGMTAEKMLIIDNPGPGRLNYAVSCNTDKSAFVPPKPIQPLGYRANDPDKNDIQEPYYPPVVKGSGGPDAFGYTWKDSDDPGGPAFAWVDIEATGTNIGSTLADDNFIGPFPIGFSFPYYDNVYTEFYISSNGLIGFGPTTDLSTLTNSDLPSTSTPNNIIAWCWDDLNILDVDSPGGKVLYQVVNGDLVIEYKNYPEYDNTTNPGDVITAEVILSQNGKIKIQYGTIAPGFDIDESTIGLENLTGTSGLPVVYNAAYLHSNLAIQFKSPLSMWLGTNPAGGYVDPHGKDTVLVQFNAADCIDSTYIGSLTLSTNVPSTPTVTIPVTMHVGGQQLMIGDANNDAAIDISDVVFIISYIFGGGPAPNPIELGDAQCDTSVDISDAVFLIEFIFSSGQAPCVP